jgi:hypothetical protein
MLPRDRVHAALNYQKCDAAALEYHPSRRGLFEHGEKLRSLFAQVPGDFEDVLDTPIPVPDPSHFDAQGEYHELRKDEWGTVWEYRIFCMTGHPAEWPLEDIQRIHSFPFPPNEYASAASFDALKARSAEIRRTRFHKAGWFGLFERMIGLRRFEDVLMDLAEDSEEINLLADRLVAYQAADIARLIEAGVDGIQFGDDYGTQQGLIMSPELWRRFFKPRLQTLIRPVQDAGVKVFFHTCGKSRELLDDFREIGVDAIWPQLSLYDPPELAAHCRDLGLAVAIHIDRAHVMTKGTPEDVEAAVEYAAKVFRPQDGGSWFYVEIDNGFPFRNVEALVKSIGRYRNP